MNEFMSMVEQYGLSMWQWFTDNKDAITAFFMSGQFASFIAALIALIKTLGQVKTNTNSTNTLNATMTKTNEMSEAVNGVDDNVKKLTKENQGLRDELDSVYSKLEYQNTQLVDKLNSIIEVQSIVYGTIRDDSVRNTVSTILNNARYSDANTKERLQKQIDELKSTFDNEFTNMKDLVDGVIDNVSGGLNAAETARKKAQELKGIDENSMRY